MQYLDHEKLDVYRAAIELVLIVEKTEGQLEPGRSYLVDQARRSSTSVVLNIAEGAGENAPAEKSRFYRIAKRSATECASVMEICFHLRLVEETRYKATREQIIRIVAMLTRLIRAKAPVPSSIPAPTFP